ncbi:MAG: hypothetical protein JST39_08600, partial [Bacteroidetes bacterium]|nr:hypothetical protein [Bacteroidota bacterium]
MFTIYDEDEGDYMKVEEPDSSLEYTYADYLQWKFQERLELIRGKIWKLSAPATLHQKVSGKLYVELYTFMKGNPCFVF